jgi:hypothetical protein
MTPAYLPDSAQRYVGQAALRAAHQFTSTGKQHLAAVFVADGLRLLKAQIFLKAQMIQVTSLCGLGS